MIIDLHPSNRATTGVDTKFQVTVQKPIRRISESEPCSCFFFISFLSLADLGQP